MEFEENAPESYELEVTSSTMEIKEYTPVIELEKPINPPMVDHEIPSYSTSLDEFYKAYFKKT